MANPEHLEMFLRGSEAWNEWRKQNRFSEPDLSGAELQRVDFRQFKLNGTDFSNTRLTKSTFDRVKLNGACFINANLGNCNFNGSDLSHANFSQADFCEARFFSTNFYRTELTGANFSQACFNFTFVNGTDLSSVLGLNLINHLGPSSIGVDTLYLSAGKIPEVFLRGCGVPEEFITYIPSFTNHPIEFYPCFISHSEPDAAFAGQLHDFLQARGVRCWLAEKQLLPGHDIYEETDRGIKLWDKMLLCASETSLKSWWVDKEITQAFSKEDKLTQRKGGKVRTLIPLDLDGFLDRWESGKADEIRTRIAADFIGWETNNTKMQEQFKRVLRALRTDEGREIPPKSGH